MNKSLKSFVLAVVSGVFLLAARPAAHAQPYTFYFQADTGGQVTQDTDLKIFFGEPLAPNTKVVFDPGVRFGFLTGFRITEWFAVELETGIMANNIKSITGASSVHNAYFSNSPLLVNARFQAPSRWWVCPFAGGGWGGSISYLDVDDISIGNTSMDGWASAGVFAYQAFGGVRFKINDRMGISVVYHYFATTDSTFEADFTSGTSSDRLRFAGTETHAASIAFDMTF